MFLGPINQSKPWDSNGIDGCFRFLRKMWNLFYPQNGDWAVTDCEPSKENLKTLHKLIKKVSEDIEDFLCQHAGIRPGKAGQSYRVPGCSGNAALLRYKLRDITRMRPSQRESLLFNVTLNTGAVPFSDA